MQGNPWNWPSLNTGKIIGGTGIEGLRLGQSAPAPEQTGSKFAPWGQALDYLIERFAPCPWSSTTGSRMAFHQTPVPSRRPLYTPAERRRRDSTGWTLVQGVLAPIQFAVFLVSLGLVLNYLATGQSYGLAAGSVVVKTLVLYAIMITGAIWEKQVFGKYLFADAFFWEDAVSMLVIALHTAYLAAMLTGWGTPHDRMVIALAAYASYAINASQFLLKLRAARLQAPAAPAPSGAR